VWVDHTQGMAVLGLCCHSNNTFGVGKELQAHEYLHSSAIVNFLQSQRIGGTSNQHTPHKFPEISYFPTELHKSSKSSKTGKRRISGK